MVVSTKGKLSPQVFVTVSLTVAVPFVTPCKVGVRSISFSSGRGFMVPDAAGITSQKVLREPPVIVASIFVVVASHIEILVPRFKVTIGSVFTVIVTFFVC